MKEVKMRYSEEIQKAKQKIIILWKRRIEHRSFHLPPLGAVPILTVFSLFIKQFIAQLLTY
jgi:hypothetical protein